MGIANRDQSCSPASRESAGNSDLLKAVYRKFTEGHTSGDLLLARQLLGQPSDESQLGRRGQQAATPLTRPARRK